MIVNINKNPSYAFDEKTANELSRIGFENPTHPHYFTKYMPGAGFVSVRVDPDKGFVEYSISPTFAKNIGDLDAAIAALRSSLAEAIETLGAQEIKG